MSILHKKISTLVAVIVLLIGVGVTSYLAQTGVIFFQHAAPSEEPQNIRITNISDSSFTVTYTTNISVIGTIALSKNGNNSQTILDDRDEQSGVPKQYMVHSISARELSPNTTYTFKILSGTTTYVNGNTPFSITTPASLSQQPSTQLPFAGKVLLPDGTVPPEALVFVTTNNGQLLSTLLNPSGLYILPLNTMRTKDFSQFVDFSHPTQLQALAVTSSLNSHVLVDTTGINPVPPITLSQDYDFTLSKNPVATSSAANFPVIPLTNTNLQATPEIITPKKDESFTDQQPQFNGTTVPNGTVNISIHSDNAITTQVTANSTGDWSYRPSTPLTPGQHTITITAPDQFGILHTLTQSFTVFAAGSQVNESATPSATLTPTNTPSPTPSKSTPTPTPTTKFAPTFTPTPGVSQAPFVTKKPTPQPTLPPTGSNTLAVAGIAGVATTLIGIVLFLVTSGATL